MSYRNLYQFKNDSHLESNDPKYQLSADQILRNVSVQFSLKLCNVIVESMSEKCKFEVNGNLIWIIEELKVYLRRSLNEIKFVTMLWQRTLFKKISPTFTSL